MWTTLVTVIRKINRNNELYRFLAGIREKGIRVIEIEPEQIYRLLGTKDPGQPFPKDESLLLTDVPKAAGEAKKAGIAVLGLERENGLHIRHADYVVQDLEGIEAEYLKMVYQRFHKEPLVIAQTERLCIRELTCEDTEDFWQLYCEAGLRISSVPENSDGAEQKQFLKAYIDCQYRFYGYGYWALTDRISGKWVGIAGVEDREQEGEYYLELGYAVIPEKRLQGYAREACLAVIQFLKEEAVSERIIKCFVPKGNIASRRTAQSIGMLQTEDVFEEFYCYQRML